MALAVRNDRYFYDSMSATTSFRLFAGCIDYEVIGRGGFTIYSIVGVLNAALYACKLDQWLCVFGKIRTTALASVVNSTAEQALSQPLIIRITGRVPKEDNLVLGKEARPISTTHNQ